MKKILLFGALVIAQSSPAMFFQQPTIENKLINAIKNSSSNDFRNIIFPSSTTSVILNNELLNRLEMLNSAKLVTLHYKPRTNDPVSVLWGFSVVLAPIIYSLALSEDEPLAIKGATTFATIGCIIYGFKKIIKGLNRGQIIDNKLKHHGEINRTIQTLKTTPQPELNH